MDQANEFTLDSTGEFFRLNWSNKSCQQIVWFWKLRQYHWYICVTNLNGQPGKFIPCGKKINVFLELWIAIVKNLENDPWINVRLILPFNLIILAFVTKLRYHKIVCQGLDHRMSCIPSSHYIFDNEIFFPLVFQFSSRTGHLRCFTKIYDMCRLQGRILIILATAGWCGR